MRPEDEYVRLRLKAFFARREGQKKEAATAQAQADRIWETLSHALKAWARKEVMAQVIAEGMSKINDEYGW